MTFAAPASQTPTPLPQGPSRMPVPMQYPPYAPPRNGYATGAWSYQPPFELHLKQSDPPIPQIPPKQPYNGAYYRNPGPPPLFDKDGRPQPLPPLSQRETHYHPTANQYRAQLQWQQPYQGPKPGGSYYRVDGPTPPQNGDTPPSAYGNENGNEKVPRSAVSAGSQAHGEVDVRAALQALASLQPSQIQAILQANPELKAAGDGQRSADGTS
jgi:hypothetical protein